ncbi:MAG TPA: serine/threonine-protein kinase [Planctomycetota bacterium]|nr:serine/threonine-protein kinase [Planctomycetota bacterium]
MERDEQAPILGDTGEILSSEPIPEILPPPVLENRLLGHCKLLRKLGQGGMGAVWLARHQTLEKDVAVKVLPSGFASDKDALGRFLREARSAARLEHPNVVQVLDAGSEDGIHFIVMQLVDGTDLEKLLKKKGRFQVADSLAIAKRVALALGAAHDLGIVHRDIKPANIMLTKAGRIMVTDFGLAREVAGGASITNSQEAIGTPQYIAPEQARGEAVDGRSDLYSLGGTLYTLLSGKSPFTGKSPMSIALKHASPDEKPNPLREHVPDLPEDVEALVAKLMAKKPADRFQNSGELVRAIDLIKGGRASLISTSQDRVSPGTRRKLLLAGGAAGLGILLLVGLLIALLGPSSAERAFRQAGSAMTDPEKIALYRQVVERFPGTPWADQAAARAKILKRSLLDRDLTSIKLAGLEGKVPLKDLITRIDLLRPTYPQDAKSIDAMELTLHRLRVTARTRDFGEALRTHKPEEKGERFKEFIAPELMKKTGEGWVMFTLRLLLGGMAGAGIRVEEFDLEPNGMTLESRKESVVPVKAIVHNNKSRERSPHKLTIRWIWQEGDWYLADKGIQEEK